MNKGMFVDTSICTGCKACQVACKEWNGLAPEPGHFNSDPETKLLATYFTGDSYDNTGAVVARVALPAGTSPLAIGRDARKFLALDGTGAVQLCGTDVPPSPPRTVDAVPSLAHPIEGIGVCGH